MTAKSNLLEKRQWLQDMKNGKGGDLVIGADLDGWISGLILTNHSKATIRGVYNNRELALHKGYRGDECVFVDFDIARQNVRSIGHHITSHSKKNSAAHLYHPEGVQINDIYDTCVKHEDAKRSFSYKYPFSTAIFLLWIFDYDLMKMSKWQRFLFLQADGVVNNVNNYPHSIQEWTNRIFGNFMQEPLASISLMESSIFNTDFRRMRSKYIPKKNKSGQGKGTEKGKVIEVSKDGELLLEQVQFIKALGEQIGFPYLPERWKCWSDMQLHKLKASHCDKRPVENFRALIELPESLVSLIFSNTAGKIDYTTGDKETIASAFGLCCTVANKGIAGKLVEKHDVKIEEIGRELLATG